MWHRSFVAAALAAALGAACADRAPLNPAAGTNAPPGVDGSQRPERLARMFARALSSPAFRAYLKAQLDASPVGEHKLAFQPFLGAHEGRALRYFAEQNGTPEADVAREAQAAIALETYLPVPAHRAAWTGDDRVLVATAITDREPPVAFDVQGRRHVLDPDEPPDTPVIALVPVEADFTPSAQRAMVCPDCPEDGGGGGDDEPAPQPAAPGPGLYMTKAHFVQDFEGWLKGAPEFEVHILGQKGQTDSLLSYQCAGERQGGPYFFNQDELDWSGRVLLFSQQQLDQYNAAHPGQNVRVFLVEDDDTPCVIKTDPDRFRRVIAAVDSVYRDLTAGNDSSTGIARVFRYAPVARDVWEALADFFKSNDELVGNAVQDEIVGQFYPGYNWFVKGDDTITNGWINLVMY